VASPAIHAGTALLSVTRWMEAQFLCSGTGYSVKQPPSDIQRYNDEDRYREEGNEEVEWRARGDFWVVR